MSKRCEVCGKQKQYGNSISFSHRRGNRTWSPNLQRVLAKVNGSNKRIYVCTRCLRSGKVQRAL